MRFLVSCLILIAACIHAPRNLAESYVAAIDPDAVCLRWGQGDGVNDAVLCREKSLLFYCSTNASKRTTCQQLADLTPKPPQPPQPKPTTPPTSAPLETK